VSTSNSSDVYMRVVLSADGRHKPHGAEGWITGIPGLESLTGTFSP